MMKEGRMAERRYALEQDGAEYRPGPNDGSGPATFQGLFRPHHPR
jgi:hypothetical protein